MQGSILYLDGVTVSFDGFKALNSLSLIIGEGEMRAIIGPNGAGKTTMMDVITGKTRPDEGEVLFGGDIDLTTLDEADDRQARHRPQVPEAHRSSRAHTVVGQHRAGAGRQPRRGGQPVPPPVCRWRSARIEEILETVGLTAQRDAAGGASQPRPEAVAGDRHAAGAGTEAAAGRRAGRRHDRRRDRGDGASC